MGKPVQRNITVTRGTTYTHQVEFFDNEAQTVPSDVSGHTFTAQARSDYYPADEAVDFAVDDSNAATGKIVLSLTPTQTAAMLPGDTGVWDIDDNDAGAISTPFGGRVKMFPQVTHA